MIIGIDASRSRSGGAKTHLIGILNDSDPILYGITAVHIWSYKKHLNELPNHKWIIKHNPKELEKSLPIQLFWQYFSFPKEAKKVKCNLVLNLDAGSISPFHPSVTMSRDMLSYEKGEINRFGFGAARLRLFILRYVQNHSLKKSDGAIFLTKYASRIIQGYCRGISNYTIIPHGISDKFRVMTNNGLWRKEGYDHIRCIYVSNIALHKHQWNIVKAIKYLREKGFNLSVNFVGGGEGRAQRIFEKEVQIADPKNEFITQLGCVGHDEIPDLLSKSDIFLFASSCENMPNTLIEGMSSGLPIACSDRGPMSEVLKDGGIYFDPENYVSIANAIEELICNEQKRLSFSKRARELAYHYSWSRCAEETFEYMVKCYKNYCNDERKYKIGL